MGTLSFDGCGDGDKIFKSNGNGDRKSKILSKFDLLSSLIMT